jgi:hypothetical protein
MPVSAELYAEDDTIVFVYQEPFVPLVDVASASKDIWEFHQRIQRPLYVIYDVSGVEVSFIDVVQTMSIAPKSEYQITELPLTIYLVFEKTNIMIELGMKAFHDKTYGKVRVLSAKTTAEALATIRQERITLSK